MTTFEKNNSDEIFILKNEDNQFSTFSTRAARRSKNIIIILNKNFLLDDEVAMQNFSISINTSKRFRFFDGFRHRRQLFLVIFF